MKLIYESIMKDLRPGTTSFNCQNIKQPNKFHWSSSLADQTSAENGHIFFSTKDVAKPSGMKKYSTRGTLGARSIQPKFPEISVRNSMELELEKFWKMRSTFRGGPLFWSDRSDRKFAVPLAISTHFRFSSVL